MSATNPKKLDVSRAIRDALRAVLGGDGQPFFKTVKRGMILTSDSFPGVGYRRKGWVSELKGSTDNVQTVATYQFFIVIKNPGTNVDQLEEDYDIAISKAEEAMENLNSKRFRAVPVGGADDVAQEQVPECAASMEYEIEYERPRGRP